MTLVKIIKIDNKFSDNDNIDEGNNDADIMNISVNANENVNYKHNTSSNAVATRSTRFSNEALFGTHKSNNMDNNYCSRSIDISFYCVNANKC